MSVDCAICGNAVNPHDLGTWKQVIGWVGGPRKDAMTLRTDTGLHAHDSCIQKLKGGQAADQETLEEAENPLITAHSDKSGDLTIESDGTLHADKIDPDVEDLLS